MIMRTLSALAISAMLAGSALAQTTAPTSEPAPAPAVEAQPAAPSAPQAAESPTAATPQQPTESSESPASVADCQGTAAKLGELAEAKVIPEAQLEKLDELFGRLEALCDGAKFADAAAIAGDIKTVIESN